MLPAVVSELLSFSQCESENPKAPLVGMTAASVTASPPAAIATRFFMFPTRLGAPATADRTGGVDVALDVGALARIRVADDGGSGTERSAELLAMRERGAERPTDGHSHRSHQGETARGQCNSLPHGFPPGPLAAPVDHVARILTVPVATYKTSQGLSVAGQ